MDGEKSLSKAASSAFMFSESARCLGASQETCFEAFAPAMSLGLSKQREIGPTAAEKTARRKSSGFLTSFFCLQHPTPPLCRLQSQAGILFIIFCRASHAIFIKRRKGKARGSVCERGDKRRKWSYLYSQWQHRKKDGSWGAGLFGLS